MDVCVSDVYPLWDAAKGRTETVVYGRDVLGRSAAVRLANVPSTVLMQITWHASHDEVSEWRSMLDSALRRWACDERECDRTKCTCDAAVASEKPGMVFQAAPCRRDMAQTFVNRRRELVTGARLVLRRPFKGYTPKPLPFVEFSLAEAFLGGPARRFIYKNLLPKLGLDATCEVFESKDDSLVNLVDASSEAYFERHGRAGGIRGFSWIRVPEQSAVDVQQQKTRCALEFACEFREIDYVDEARVVPLHVSSIDIETFVTLTRMSAWLEDDSGTGREREFFARFGRLSRPELRDPDNGDAILSVAICTMWHNGPANVDTQQRRVGFIWGPNGARTAPAPQGPEYYETVECADERDMLVKFFAFLRDHADADILLGYNSDTFDWPYLFGRAYLHGVEPDFSRVPGAPCFSWAAERNSAARGDYDVYYYSIPGTVAVDALNIVRNLKRDLRSYTLNSVAKKFLGDQKKDMPYTQIVPKHQGTPDDRRELLSYNVHDTVLPPAALTSIKAWDAITAEAFVFCCPLRLCLTTGQQARNLRMARRKAIARGIVIAKHRTVQVEVRKRAKIKLEGSAASRRAAATSHKLESFCAGPPPLVQSDSTQALSPDESDSDSDDDEEERGAWDAMRSTVEVDPDAENDALVAAARAQAARQASENAPTKKGVFVSRPVVPVFVARFGPVPEFVYEGDDSFQGAYVRVPKPGLYSDPVVCADFSSLYPSKMIADNVSPDMWIGTAAEVAKFGLVLERDTTPAESGGYLVRARVCVGILTEMLQDLLKERKKVQAEMEACKYSDPAKYAMLDQLQKNIKIAANAMYGALGAATSWACFRPGAETVTAGGRRAITKVAEYVEQHYPRYEVVYGDTDSIMVRVPIVEGMPVHVAAGSVEEMARAQFGMDALREMVDRVNKADLYPSPMSIAAECVYMKYLIGLKKKMYAALKWEADKKGRVVVKYSKATTANVRKAIKAACARVLGEDVKPVQDEPQELCVTYAGDTTTRDLLNAPGVLPPGCDASVVDGQGDGDGKKVRVGYSLVSATSRRDELGLERVAPYVMVKGLQNVRREVPIVTQNAMNEIIESVLARGGDVAVAIACAKEHLQHLLDGTTPFEHFEMSQSLGRRLATYARGMLPHVEVAFRWMAKDPAKAPREGDRVPYYFAWMPPPPMGRGGVRVANKRKMWEYARAPDEMLETGKGGLEPLGREVYVERKFEKPVTNLLKMLGATPEQIEEVFDLDLYDYVRITGRRTVKRNNVETVEYTTKRTKQHNLLEMWGPKKAEANVVV